MNWVMKAMKFAASSSVVFFSRRRWYAAEVRRQPKAITVRGSWKFFSD